MKRAALLVCAVALVACGGAQGTEPKAPRPDPSSSRPPPLPVPQEEVRTMIEIVVVPQAWVEKTLPAPPADVKAWSEVAQNRASIPTDVRHVLVKVAEDAKDADVAAAKKKAEALLARALKGEDFAKLAKASDDPGSKDKGGLYAGEMVAQFVEPFRAAYASVAPGEVVKEVVRTAFGWHVIKREAATDDQAAKAYRKAKAPELTKKLADDLVGRLKSPESGRAAIAAAVEAVLGEGANADPARPQAHLTDTEHLESGRLPREAKDGLAAFGKKAHPGDVVDAPIVTPKALVVARLPPPAR